MRVHSPTDVVIVGMGAAGGIAAGVLTGAGLEVVGLEAGPHLTSKDFIGALDEIGGWTIRNSMGDVKFNKELPTWRPNVATPAGKPSIVWGMMNAVGGGSVHYGAQSWRLAPGDFRVRSETIRRYGEAALPSGSAIADWPLGYTELEPYYGQVERTIGVSGRGGANPFEGPRSSDYPMPPLRQAGYCAMAGEAMRALGYHPFPQPAAINSVDYGGRAACSYCGYCAGFGCWNDSKSSTLVTTIQQAEASGRLDLRPLCTVTRIQSDARGRVTGVQYRTQTGELVEQPARFVILSSFVYENTRRLLLSKSEYYPNGLSNNNGQVGRYYISHAYVMCAGVFPGRKLNLFSGTTGQAIAMDDLNGDNFDHAGLGFIRGGMVFAYNQTLPIGAASALPPDVPKWGQRFKDWIRTNAQSVGLMYCQVETLPYESNFLDLDPRKADTYGDPVVRVTYDLHDNDKRRGDFIANRLEQILHKMGSTKTWLVMPAAPVPVNTHAFGGTRMGNDPATSVVNRYGISHEAPNLAVMGGSQFPSISGYNPTQTIQALSWRTADYIAGNFKQLAA
jgi:gluconate 2-dehydrogenase alpha chain